MRHRTRLLAVVVLGAVLTSACASSSGDHRTGARSGKAQPPADVEVVVDPADAMVEAVTTDFWDVYLGDQSDALDRLLADADVPGLTTVKHDAG